MGEWTSIYDKLPPIGVLVLCYYKSTRKCYLLTRLDPDREVGSLRFIDRYDALYTDPSHWIEIPELPELPNGDS